MTDAWLSARDARLRLGVRPQTLYAYVSRGLLRAEPDPRRPQTSRYRAEDIESLAGRRGRSRRRSEVAAGAIAWGEPVLPSAITTIADGRLFYRGRDAAGLAETETLESVARLLRGGHGASLKGLRLPLSAAGTSARERLFSALALRAGADAPARGRAPLALAAEAAELLDVVADAAGPPARAVAALGPSAPIHGRLAAAWGADDGSDAVRRALVLLADHELNASTFAARVAASTGASLAAAALAGLAALSGPLHGGMSARVENLVEEAERVGPREAVEGRLARAGPIPGFGHPLYPAGDPRAAALLAAAPPPPHLLALKAAVEGATGQRANVDFALVCLAHAHRLPADAPFAIFAVARCAGWLAHAMEQVAEGVLIRPRARYVGAPPMD
ncbi:MAG TPA: citrate synthase [Caulobacteraceae bacterium]|nr:citrate synthase [Caulobacteraceae bacterium]